MRKVLKLMFSQITIVSLLLLLQLFVMTATLMRISKYFVYFDIFLRVISAVTVIIIINRHSNPSYKLAWVVPILIFPLFGGLFYLFITGQMHKKYYFRKLTSLEDEINRNYPQSEEITVEIGKSFPGRENAVKYINNVSGMSAYRTEEVKYFPLGEDMHKSILDELKKAHSYIFLEYFIIKEGVFWDSILEILKRKAAEGVDVRVMYDGMGSLSPLPLKYNKTLESYGIKCRVFSPFVPFLSALQNNRDHRKILVIDGRVAYTGGINLSDEYINADSPLGHWKDTAVMVTGDAAFGFARLFLHLWWQIEIGKPNESIADFEPEKKESPLSHGFVMPFGDIPQDEYQTGEFIYLDIINKAKNYVWITTPYLILDNEMTVALKNAAKSGVDVRIICPRTVDHKSARAVGYSYYKELMEAGVRLYEYTPGFIHAKMFISDDEVCVVGSINLDYRSLYLHFECASWFLGGSIIDDVKNDFENTFQKCEEINPDIYKNTNPLRKLLNAILRLFAPLM